MLEGHNVRVTLLSFALVNVLMNYNQKTLHRTRKQEARTGGKSVVN